MNRQQAMSRCECQAVLTAELDAKRQAIRGAAIRLGLRENAPAHTIGAEAESFDIAWMCPFCGRNTLRSFYAGALRTIVVSDPPVAPPAPAA